MESSSDLPVADDGYIADVPRMSLASNYLWSDQGDDQDNAILKEIRTISSRVVKPLVGPASQAGPGGMPVGVPSIVYAVHGGWGTGKSSFLQIVQSEARRRAEGLDRRDQLRCVYFNAVVYEGIPVRAGVTLAMRLLETIGGKDADRFAQPFRTAAFSGGAQSRGRRRPTATAGPRTAVDRQPRTPAKGWQPVAEWLAHLVDFPKVIEQCLLGQAGDQRGTVKAVLILIDELDRCRPEFVYEVLRTVRHWSEAPNQVYMLAVDEEPLRKAIVQRAGTESGYDSPSYALQKYFQHAIRLPSVDGRRLEAVLNGLLAEQAAPELKEILGCRELVSVALAGDESLPEEERREFANPRKLIQALNAIRWRVSSGLEQLERLSPNHTPDDRRLVVKDAILAYRWREFHDLIVHRGAEKEAGVGSVRHRDVLRALERACREELGSARLGRESLENWTIVEFMWNLRLDQIPEAKLDFRRDLARYLGLPPFWFPPGEDGRSDGSFRSSGDPADVGRQRSPVDQPSVVRLETLAPEDRIVNLLKSQQGPEAERRRELFTRLYFEARAAEAEDDRETALAKVHEMAQYLAQNRDFFGPRHAGDVGNAAILAERLRDLQLAYSLYRLALDLDPEHSNNIQNFVDFIVQSKVQQLYPVAETFLQQLQQPPHDQHKPEQTIALQVRLAALQQEFKPGRAEGESVEEADIERAVAQVKRDPLNRSTFNDVAQVLAAVGQYARLSDLLGYLDQLDQLGAHPELRYHYRRGVADLLAVAPDPRQECEAMNIYRELQDWPQPQQSLAEIRHNYASLLYAHDYDEEAGRQWFRAYQTQRDDSRIRRAYGDYLLRAAKPDIAVQVIRGELLQEREDNLLIPSRSLPVDSFWDDFQRRRAVVQEGEEARRGPPVDGRREAAPALPEASEVTQLAGAPVASNLEDEDGAGPDPGQPAAPSRLDSPPPHR